MGRILKGIRARQPSCLPDECEVRTLFEEGVRDNESVERHAAGTDDAV